MRHVTFCAALVCAGPAWAGDGVFVAVGYGGRRMVSEDGVNWKITAEWIQPGKDDKYNLMGLVHAEGKFVAVGGGGGGRTGGGHILVSRDGRDWKKVFSPKGRVSPIAHGGGRFVVGSPRRTLMWSDGGEVWHAGARIASKKATHFRRGAFGNGVFVFLGNHGGSRGPHWLAVSKDGTKIDHYREDMPANRAVAFGGGRFVIVGPGGVRRSSADGKTWANHDGDDGDFLSWAVWTGKRFLAGGRGKVFASPDGRAWSKTDFRVPGSLKWSDGKRHIATGWPGKMFYSTDGKSWKRGTPLPANGINQVVFGRAAGQ